jgi:hypothetical protein
MYCCNASNTHKGMHKALPYETLMGTVGLVKVINFPSGSHVMY